MAASFSLPTVLANLAAGNQPLSLIDGDFTAVYNPLVSLNTFSNYYTDVGSVNAYLITVSSPQTISLTAGLSVDVLISTANTGPSTFQINSLGVQSVTRVDGSALNSGDMPLGSICRLQYDGTKWQLQTTNLTTTSSPSAFYQSQFIFSPTF
jgi:hypothetical protein